MNREPLTGNGNAQMATGMITRIARRTRREWFVDARIAGHFSNKMLSVSGGREKRND